VFAPSAASICDGVTLLPCVPPNHELTTSPRPARRNRSMKPSGPPVRSSVIS
jgi:hypothetical protein